MRVEGVLLENMKEVMLVVRMQEVEVKEGFGAIGAGDGKDAVVNAERDEGVEMVGMGCAKGTGEGAGTNEANNQEGGENEAEDEAAYLLQTATRTVSSIGRNQQMNFTLKALQQ